jgi:hypothetical protein
MTTRTQTRPFLHRHTLAGQVLVFEPLAPMWSGFLWIPVSLTLHLLQHTDIRFHLWTSHLLLPGNDTWSLPPVKLFCFLMQAASAKQIYLIPDFLVCTVNLQIPDHYGIWS